MAKLILVAVFMLLAADNINATKTLPFISYYIGDTVTIPLPPSANYRRVVQVGFDLVEQLYRVCNGKNKKTCGYWESVETKKKVASGVTTYNKKKKALIIKKMRNEDGGTYMIGNKKTSRMVMGTVRMNK
ncbi:unnamed protein product [Caenorhabditis brenneri]